MSEKLNHDAVNAGLDELPGWSLVNEKLHRESKFGNFVKAFGFMTSADIESEKMDHHPDVL